MKVATAPSETASAISEHLCATVEGTPVEFNAENLTRMADHARIKTIYKLNNPRLKRGGVESGATNGVTEKSGWTELEVLAIGMMALRGQT